MARTPPAVPTGRTAHYAIEVAGHLDASRLDDLRCTELRRDPAGRTVLVADVPDQAALYGVLARLRDLGVPLLALTRLDRDPATPGAAIPSPTPNGAPDA
jgi:hypothetical protein